MEPEQPAGGLDECVRQVVLPYLTGEGDEEAMRRICVALAESGPPGRAWVLRVLWLYHETLLDVRHLDGSAAARARPDFLHRREEMACRVIGAAFLLARQGLMPVVREGFAGTAEVLASGFIKAEQ